jgi:DNA topoisomerase-3
VVLKAGWKQVEPGAVKRGNAAGAEENKGEDGHQTLPPLEQGQRLHVRRMEVLEKETRPPRPYNDATLLAAMKSAGREIEEERLAEAMRQSGLGTSATRAEIIEKLIRTGYVQRERKQLCSTEKGRALIGLVAGPLRSPELTAEWEQQLKEVEEGKRSAGEFYRRIVRFIRELVPEVAEGPALSPEEVAAAREELPGRKGKGRKGGVPRRTGLGGCPLCKEGEIVETAKAYGCSRYRKGCRLTIWKTVAGLKLTKQQVEQLLREGRTARIEGFTSKAGKPFAARLKLGEGFKVEFDFADGPQRDAVPGDETAPNQTGDRAAERPALARAEAQSAPASLICPKCGQGSIIEGRRGYGCNRFREGCDFVVWKEISGKQLTVKQIHALIGKGKTRLIKGFNGRSGKKFDARLRLDEQWKVVFAFLNSKQNST